MARHAWEDLLYGNGCGHHKDCFTCPFDDCIEGTLIDGYKAVKNQAQILMKKGKSIREIMDILHVSQASVYRYRRGMS